MSHSKPAILFIIFKHGAYHPPSCYSRLTEKLETAGFELVTPRLASLGEGKVGITLDDDVAVVKTAAKALIDAGKEVVLVAHSYGGFVTINAAKGLSVTELQAQGQEGGIKHIVYLSACFKEKGATANEACNPTCAVPPDFDDIFAIHMVGEKVSCSLKDTETTRRYFLQPASDEDMNAALAQLEPMCVDIFNIPSPTGPSELSIPQTFFVCGKDHVVLPETQEKAVADGGMRAIRLPESGHAPYLNLRKSLQTRLSR
ncbi:hypothetical protein PFICI_07373 [Pestalotiopsis fici W106-1]|uniref:AB hydrolase-1 domain-containing protein n=1 Tax=Pestalotiopsis fici (strain W106-1 / CGMCC3.15140) TaxID=1229662 RepID=W3X1F7_PESFW|nr:uncharacterized protein PFICI_07373 [Pestalotiopsis fici W106-1]ETS79844.1 hypothetical protein PFICI_07373 [Pestalotiopsis fici W106-1]